MLTHAAIAIAVGAILWSPLIVPPSIAAAVLEPQTAEIERQISADANVTFERTGQAGAVTRRWNTTFNISNCIADVEIEVATTSRGTTTIARHTAKFHLSRISAISRLQGGSFNQEVISLDYHPDANGKTPARNYENGVEKPFHYLRSGSGISFQTVDAADRTVSNIGKLQRMCGSR
jgi:hypothetical protein